MNELQLLEAAASKRVLFVGETISDVYHYCKPLGKPTKDAIVAVEQTSTEIFVGGVAAAAAHAIEFAATVEVFTSETAVVKARYVEASHTRKLFEVYGSHTVAPQNPASLSGFDTIIVTDYGHGMIEGDLLHRLQNGCVRYLAVNVQTNSGNYGFNLATKYESADYLCVDEPEARLATQNRSGPVERSLEALSQIAPKVVITLGKSGAIGFDRERISRCEAFVDQVVDTMGAGDAFFALTALVAQEADMPTLLRIGNAAGAIKAGIVGHRGHVTKEALFGLLGSR